MLAEYNLGLDYRQSVVPNNVKFSETVEWEYEPGEQEIDIQTWSTNPKTYINAYVDYLKEELNDNSVTGDLITLKELKKLGCRIQEDYSYTEEDLYCEGWVGNHQSWWTRSAISNHYVGVWYVYRYNIEGNDYHYTRAGVRPVITISKSALKEYLKA
jgi:hypothetical protein